MAYLFENSQPNAHSFHDISSFHSKILDFRLTIHLMKKANHAKENGVFFQSIRKKNQSKKTILK